MDGTSEVADAVALAVTSIVDGSGNFHESSLCDRIRTFGLPELRSAEIAGKLEKLAEKIEFLSDVRKCTHFFRCCYKETRPVDKKLWEPYAYHCTLAVLSKLRESDSLILPSDFFCLNLPSATSDDASVPSVGHATTLVIERENYLSPTCEIHHFETNGDTRPKIFRQTVAKKREFLAADGEKYEDKSKKFLVTDFLESDLQKNSITVKEKPKSFLRRTTSVDFDSLISRPRAKCLVKDVDALRRMLFLEIEGGIDNYPSMIARQDDAFNNLNPSFCPDLESQRLHAVQGTGSCELKSTTVAGCFLLNDEVAYQVLMGLFVNRTYEQLKTIAGEDAKQPLIDLKAEKDDMVRRVENAYGVELLT